MTSDKVTNDLLFGAEKDIFIVKYHVNRHKIIQNKHLHSSCKQLGYFYRLFLKP
jgi:hypothetical protein